MSNEEPVRLKLGGGVSPQLVRALRALADSRTDAARLTRVAERLGATFAKALPPTAAANGWTLIAAKPLAIALCLATTASLTWLAYEYGRSSAREHAPILVPQSPPSVAAVPPVPIAERAPLVETRELAVATGRPVASASNGGTSASHAQPRGSHRLGAGRASSVSAPTSTGRAPLPSDATASAAVEVALATPVVSLETVAVTRADSPSLQPMAAAVAPVAPRSVEARPIAPQRSEAALLFDARRASGPQPLAALRLLEEHARRFAEGVLAPEREVMRIEVLRKLGRTEEAAQRLHNFEARYPSSIHRQRLQQQ